MNIFKIENMFKNKMVKDDLILGGGNVIQCTDHISWRCVGVHLPVGIILSTNVTTIHFLKE